MSDFLIPMVIRVSVPVKAPDRSEAIQVASDMARDALAVILDGQEVKIDAFTSEVFPRKER